MKYFISILLLSLCSLSSAAEYGQLAPNDTIAMQSGDIIKILAFNYRDGTVFTFNNGSGVNISYDGAIIYGMRGATPDLLTFVGPGVLQAAVSLHYKLSRAPNPQPAQATTPAN